MTDETLDNAGIQPEAPAVEPASEPDTGFDDLPELPDNDPDSEQEQPGTETDSEDEGAEDREGEESAEGDAEEWAEIEIDGKTYKVPAEIKDGYLRQADYTRKRQEDAEFRKELEARQADLQRAQQVSEEEFNARVSLAQVEAEIARYQAADWDKLYREKPNDAARHYARFNELQRFAQQQRGVIESAHAERSRLEQENLAARVEKTAEWAKKNIPNWSPDLDARITDFVREEYGLSDERIQALIGPTFYKIAYHAHLGKQAEKRATKPRSQSAKPLKTVSSRHSGEGTKRPHEMSMEEYAKWSERAFKD